MKTALLAFGDFDVSKARELFKNGGITLSTVQVLSDSDDIGFKRGYEVFRDMADVLIVADGAAFDLKEKVAEFSDCSLLENENARDVIERNGFTDFSGALMPPDATLIPNDCGAYQGFTLDDRDFTLIVLPAAEKEFVSACEKYVLPYLAEKAGKQKPLIFKCFGNKTETERVLNGLRQDVAFGFDIEECAGDLTVSVYLDRETDKRLAEREIAFALKDICYTDSNGALAETLFTLLKLSGKKIAVAESFTGGKVATEIIKNSGASDYFNEGIVAYTNASKIKRLFVSETDLTEYGAVSAKIAYQMAAGLFKSGEPDVVLATTGIAGPNGDGTGVPVGRCYIAAGTKRGIHTYKFDFAGTRDEITKKGVNAALFIAVKTIKNL